MTGARSKNPNPMKSRRILLIISPFLIIPLVSLAQKQNHNWYFGNYAGLSFHLDPPTPLISDLRAEDGVASVSDPEGNLLFYTNGSKIWDRKHNIMPNGEGLPAIVAGQVLIAPVPNDGSRYYIFTPESYWLNGGIYTSIVDMRLNGGYGDIVAGEKNTILNDFVDDKVTSVLHANGRDIWIITHALGSNTFLVYLLGSQGLDKVPVISSVGTPFTSSTSSGGMKISHGKDKLVVSTEFQVPFFLEMYNFDNATGIVSNPVNLNLKFNPVLPFHGIEFSPNDSLLYVAGSFSSGQFTGSYTFQIELATGDVVKISPDNIQFCRGLQLGPDNKIYLARAIHTPEVDYLGVIHFPDKPGLACMFESDGLLLHTGTNSRNGLPQFVQYSYPLDTIPPPIFRQFILSCEGLEINLAPNYPVNCDSTAYLWSTGSTAPTLQVTQAGYYWVEINGPCGYARDTVLVYFVSCDPIVYYDLEECRSYMSDGSNMDFSEFKPAYPNEICAEVTAGILHRELPQEQKHSCTPGVGDGMAMCISTPEICAFEPDHPSALTFTVQITPPADSVVVITGLEFYQQGPAVYNWIDGPSGPNNFPTRYGIRVLINDVEVFKKEDRPTSQVWTLEKFDWLSDSGFRIIEPSTIRIEWLPYCQVGNGATVAAWDIDEIRLFGGCLGKPGTAPVIQGQVLTRDGKPVPGAVMQLSADNLWSGPQTDTTDVNGDYKIDWISGEDQGLIRGNKDDYPREGVSALDLIAIQRHLLGQSPFTSLYEYVAADADRNGKVNVLDLVEIRKLLLGMYDHFPRNTSWRIGPATQEMEGTDPDSFVEEMLLAKPGTDTLQLNFTAIKIGDVNGDVVPKVNKPEKKPVRK